jgi:hypothetical protein
MLPHRPRPEGGSGLEPKWLRRACPGSVLGIQKASHLHFHAQRHPLNDSAPFQHSAPLRFFLPSSSTQLLALANMLGGFHVQCATSTYHRRHPQPIKPSLAGVSAHPPIPYHTTPYFRPLFACPLVLLECSHTRALPPSVQRTPNKHQQLRSMAIPSQNCHSSSLSESVPQ